MATGERITVRGADEVARTLQAFAESLAELPDADAGALVQRSAQGFARRRTGRMRASITVKTTEVGATVTAGVGIVRPYPLVQEYGSARRGITANRYMARAAEAQFQPVVNLYESAIDKAADKVRGA